MDAKEILEICENYKAGLINLAQASLSLSLTELSSYEIIALLERYSPDNNKKEDKREDV